MELYLPSICIMLFAAFVIFAFIPRLTPFILVCIASLSLVLAVWNHTAVFSAEYRNMNWTNMASATATTPFIMIGFVIILSIGYILMLISRGQLPSLSMAPTPTPSPNTATNVVTRAIGNGLVNTGMVDAPRYNARDATNNARAAFESGLSKAV